jgi:hypothetical protein
MADHPRLSRLPGLVALRPVILILTLAVAPACQRIGADPDRPSPDAALRYLAAAEDRDSQAISLYTEPDAGSNLFWPSWWENGADGLLINAECGEKPHGGAACMRIAWDGSSGEDSHRWRGVIFHDSPNWVRMTGPGYDLRAATRLVVWWRPVRLDGDVKFVFGHFDEPQGEITRTFDAEDIDRDGGLGAWRKLEFDLHGHDLRSVHTVLQVIFEGAAEEPVEPGTVLDLDDAAFDCPPPVPQHLPNSYEVRLGKDFRWTHNASHVYDDSLVALAHMARGDAENMRRAGAIVDAMVYAATHDRRFTDGRLRNAYSAGPLALHPGGAARCVSWWDPVQRKQCEDYYCDGSTTGNVAWALIAILEYAKIRPPAEKPHLLAAANGIARWLAARYDSTRAWGFFGGFEGFDDQQTAVTWKSTEHALDVYVALTRYAALLPDAAAPPWKALADRARSFVDDMWDEKEGRYLTGATDKGALNTEQKPADVNCWATLVFGKTDRTVRAMHWVEANCSARDPDSGLRGFGFSPESDGIWWEGTAHAALAFAVIGESEKAAFYLSQLILAQAFYHAGGAVPSASKDELRTGFTLKTCDDEGRIVDKPWYYYRIPHICATAWVALAQMHWNPYLGEPTP